MIFREFVPQATGDMARTRLPNVGRVYALPSSSESIRMLWFLYDARDVEMAQMFIQDLRAYHD